MKFSTRFDSTFSNSRWFSTGSCLMCADSSFVRNLTQLPPIPHLLLNTNRFNSLEIHRDEKSTRRGTASNPCQVSRHPPSPPFFQALSSRSGSAGSESRVPSRAGRPLRSRGGPSRTPPVPSPSATSAPPRRSSPPPPTWRRRHGARGRTERGGYSLPRMDGRKIRCRGCPGNRH